MAVSLADRVGLALNPDFQRQVRMGCLAVALTIADEPNTVTNSAYGKRQALAQQVLTAAATPQFVERFAWAVAASLTAQPSDTTIQQSLTDNWTKLAGVTALDTT